MNPPYGKVSIHAPARGATRQWRQRLSRQSSFNPRARAGRDVTMAKFAYPEIWFQSTRPRGARRKAPQKVETNAMFQSTRPRGARPVLAIPRTRQDNVSIHAPARGATWQDHKPDLDNLVSIHAPARGATSLLAQIDVGGYSFQSTRPRGARREYNYSLHC